MKNIFIKRNAEWFAIITFFLLYVCTGGFRYSKVVDYQGIYLYYILSFTLWFLIRTFFHTKKYLFFIVCPMICLFLSCFIMSFYYFNSGFIFFLIHFILCYIVMGYIYLSLLMILFYKILK